MIGVYIFDGGMGETRLDCDELRMTWDNGDQKFEAVGGPNAGQIIHPANISRIVSA